ncbi:MAG: 23S rRNA (uracil(1939)-C(5))-methyltransferase RlmD [Prevotella sp.]|nr:23S rRNA (uracil(1939)-C(5))-methyltransferase RlmD [Prevotella sp.]
MGRKKKPLPILENITITDYAADGKSIARVDNMVVFVPFAVPGDVVDLQVFRKKHSYMEAQVQRFIKYSERRQEPFCKHFGTCGGCKWQMIPYEEQLRMKHQQVVDQLIRIAKIKLPKFEPIMGSVKNKEYRNKMDFACSNRRFLTKEEVATLPRMSLDQGEMASAKNVPAMGFHITGAFDKVLPIQECWLMDRLHNDIRNGIYAKAVELGMTFFDLRAQVGLLRDVIMRNSNTGEWMIIVMFHFSHDAQYAQEKEQADTLLKYIADTFPQITSLLWLDNQKGNDTIGDQEIFVYKGNDHIYEQMEDLRFKVGPKSFYQTNTEQAYELYKVVRHFAFRKDKWLEALPEKPLVYDLYTGTGTIANFVAHKASRVIGIEYVEEAIADAKINAEINGNENTAFFAGDMKDILTDDFIAEHGRPDVIITDPPRAGMHPDVVKTILQASPTRIVYVSCNPATQARDLQMMDEKYEVMAIQPVDMFPHTPHVENVALLHIRK